LTDQDQQEKPRTVLYAEWILWLWTAWACLFGIYETWQSIPEIESAISEQLQDLITVKPSTLLEVTVASYTMLAALSAWVVVKIGEGKNWARSTLLWGFVLEVLWMAVPPYHTILEYLTDGPDIILQISALYLLYRWPGNAWFKQIPKVKAQ